MNMFVNYSYFNEIFSDFIMISVFYFFGDITGRLRAIVPAGAINKTN